MKKNRRDKKMVYKRFNLLLAIEGPIPDGALWKVLTGKTALSGSTGTTAIKLHHNLSLDALEGRNALVARPVPIYVPNGKNDRPQRLLTVWGEDGRISHEQVERLKITGELAFLATVEVKRDRQGESTGHTIHGQGRAEVMHSDAIFVRKSRDDEPLESEFVMTSLGSYVPSRVVRRPSFVSIDSAQPGGNAVALSTMTPNDPSASGDSIRIPVDPITGDVIDHIGSDGTVGFGFGPHDQVILLLKEYGRVIKGTKAKMLEERIGILSGLRNVMPDEETFHAVRRAVDEFDPTAGVLLVSLPDGKVTLMPSSIIPETE